MISPEMLKRYPFFGQLSDGHIKALAAIAEEVTWESGEAIFELGDRAEALYFLKEGSIDLYDRSEDINKPELTKEFLVGQVNPGEPFGISALLEPNKLIATAVAGKPSAGIRMDGEKLNEMSAAELEMENALLRELARAILERLTYARVQLAAARP